MGRSGPGRATARVRLAAVGIGFVAIAVVQATLRGGPPWGPLLLPVYLAAGYLVAIASTVAVNRSWTKARPLLHPRLWAVYAREHDGLVARQAGVAVAEELLWRALPTYLLIELLGLPAAMLLPVSAVFTLLHLPGHEIYPWELLELFAFSALLAVVYLCWRDLALVVALHLVRNVSRGYLLSVGGGIRRPTEGPGDPDSVLRADPCGAYARSDDRTRFAYLGVLARWSRWTGLTEHRLAEMVLEKARAAAAAARDPAAAHVGYYLVGPGEDTFEREIGVRLPAPVRLRRAVQRRGWGLYLGLLCIGTLAVVTAAVVYGASQGAGAVTLAAVGLAVFPIALDLATGFARRSLSAIVPERVLPRLEPSVAAAEELRTLVVVPTVVADPADVLRQLGALEQTARRTRSAGLRFALLSDFVDADRRATAEDAEILECAARAVRRLNACYRGPLGDRFFVLHRERRWSAGEGLWTGWERKRGKLEELNRLLRDPDAPGSYRWIFGDLRPLLADPGFRYVLAIDEDSVLAPGAATELIRTAAHPLNRPVYDPEKRRVTEGYTIVQPSRVGIPDWLLDPSRKTRLSSILGAAESERRPVRTGRDFLFDLVGDARYAGKGVYDVDAFRLTLEGRFPDDLVLMHDHVEGAHARVATAREAILLEQPSLRYLTSATRDHRWTRGDWQLLRWLLPTLPDASGERRANALSIAARTRLLLQALRSTARVSPPILLLLAWVWLPGSVAVWTVIALPREAAGLVILACRLCLASLRPERVRPTASPWRPLARLVTCSGVSIALLPHQAAQMLDAIVRGLWRLLVTRRNLTTWTRQREVESGARLALSSYVLALRSCVASAAGATALVSWLAPQRLPVAAPILLAWLAAPVLAWYLDRPAK